ncbi:hypothetical protein B296_00051656 [Ensete ventricosum]|uniref:Uncharacterized protein n=1 Tax=Ensete ventricosum TaxID=4639 RepID=A0A426YFT3_ENSVE|nr:hypothetical protein B296_00051656 [Ensete ventricosum]
MSSGRTKQDLHDLLRVPENGVVMEVSRGVEPEVEPHLPANDPAVSASPDVHIGLQSVWLTGDCAQELDIHLVMEPRVSLIVRQLQIERETGHLVTAAAAAADLSFYRARLLQRIDPRRLIGAEVPRGCLEHEEDKELDKERHASLKEMAYGESVSYRLAGDYRIKKKTKFGKMVMEVPN